MKIIDAGERQYELVDAWGALPPGWIWGQVGAVGVDSRDRVHVFTRTDHPYMIFDHSGHLERSWGRGIFEDAHGICIAPDDSVYLVDRTPQMVFKFTNDGRHELSMGNRNQPSDTGYTSENRKVTHAGPPFHHPTDVGVSPTGEFYVSDGYRNCRVHKYSADGTLLLSWGEPGDGPGQFDLVHSVWEHRGRVYVADRANNRIQIFTPEGDYLDMWTGFGHPTKIYIDRHDVMYVAELDDRVSILDLEGNVLGRWGGERTHEPGGFWGPHGIWADSQGDIYVAEVLEGARLQKFAAQALTPIDRHSCQVDALNAFPPSRLRLNSGGSSKARSFRRRCWKARRGFADTVAIRDPRTRCPRNEATMIIDIHGHFTQAPRQIAAWRARQIAAANESRQEPSKEELELTDDDIHASIEPQQLAFQRERGTDLVLFSPTAGGMAHHNGSAETSRVWTELVNENVHRVCMMWPDNFVGVCQLPQSPGISPANCVAELERCVTEWGFVGCNINPDPSDGYWTGPPITDPFWYPLYEKMVELEVPTMIHSSSSCNPAFHGTGAHYINGDTTAFMQLIQGDLFREFPTLKFVIPHGGGAIPYQWGRYWGIAQNLKKPPLEEHLLGNVFFDSCIYDVRGMQLLTSAIPTDNILFASEMIGAVNGIDPRSGHYFDDTKRYFDQVTDLSEEDRHKILEANALKVYPRLSKLLANRDN